MFLTRATLHVIKVLFRAIPLACSYAYSTACCLWRHFSVTEILCCCGRHTHRQRKYSILYIIASLYWKDLGINMVLAPSICTYGRYYNRMKEYIPTVE